MNLRRIFSAGPPLSEYEVFTRLATILQAAPGTVESLQKSPAMEREPLFLEFLKEARLGTIVDIHEDEDTIIRALQRCFPQPEHTTWNAIASEVHALPEAPAEQVLRVLIRAFAQERSALRVFASGHDYWTCVFVPGDVVEQFDSCIASSSIVGYEKPHEPYGA